MFVKRQFEVKRIEEEEKKKNFQKSATYFVLCLWMKEFIKRTI
jgi:hypothetical protein